MVHLLIFFHLSPDGSLPGILSHRYQHRDTGRSIYEQRCPGIRGIRIAGIDLFFSLFSSGISAAQHYPVVCRKLAEGATEKSGTFKTTEAG